MTHYFRLLAIFLCLSFALVSGARADAQRDFDRGDKAYFADNYAEAVKWYRRAAEQGHAVAQISLGILYDQGQGVSQDYGKAVKWYRKAAEQGDAGAQFDLGLMYVKGQGVSQNYGKAMKWFRKAAEQGNARAQSNLGFMYDLGQGVPKNYVTAHMWYNLAAAQGNENAAKNRGLLAKEMTSQQISKAQSRAASCKARSYKGC